MRETRIALVALVVALLAAAPGSAQAAGPTRESVSASAGDAKVIAAASCAKFKRRAHRYKRGSAKRRRNIRRYRRCRARVRRQRAQTPSTPSTPSTPTPSEPTTPAPPVGNLYLPNYAPNPNGYRGGQGCQPGYEQYYRAAGYSCQYAGYNQNLGTWNSPVWTPVYLLFGVWGCADGRLAFRC